MTSEKWSVFPWDWYSHESFTVWWTHDLTSLWRDFTKWRHVVSALRFAICNPSLNLLLRRNRMTLQLQQRQCFQGVGQTFSTTGAPIDTSWSSVSAASKTSKAVKMWMGLKPQITKPWKSARLMQEDWEDPEDLKQDWWVQGHAEVKCKQLKQHSRFENNWHSCVRSRHFRYRWQGGVKAGWDLWGLIFSIQHGSSFSHSLPSGWSSVIAVSTPHRANHVTIFFTVLLLDVCYFWVQVCSRFSLVLISWQFDCSGTFP